MLKVGLTGGIGAGKSTVARMLAARGAVVVDADAVAREVVEPGTPGLAAVVVEFGPAILDAAGALDRAALARLVFADPEALARLEAILHPLIAARSTELVTAAAAGPVVPVVVHDVPLLVERGLSAAGGYDLVVVVDAADELRLERLVQRGMAEADARARMAAQAGREERRARADVVITNDGDPAELEAQVDALWVRLTAPVSGGAG